MAECELLKTCPFFNDKMQNKDVAVDSYKRRFCKGENKRCARHTVFVKFGRAAVPSDLFPHELERAKTIIQYRS